MPSTAPFPMLRAALAAGVLIAAPAAAETIDITVGHQSMCTDTYTAGIVVKELKLLEKHLPRDGKYAKADYNVVWSDYASGGPITNQMLAGKLSFGVMGDFPLVVNGAKFQETKSLRTIVVAGTGYNLKGSGNALVVPAASTAHSLEDLKGKAVSTPVGSAAWGMLVKALQDKQIPLSAIELKNQAPAVGAANIATGKIDAHADFCPWSEIMEFRGTGRKIYDGSEGGVPYLHGLVVRADFAEAHPEVVTAFVKAIVDAGRWIEEDPLRATEALEKWTGVEKEVLYIYFSKGGHLTLDPTLKAQWIDTLKADHGVLAKEKLAPALNVDDFVTEAYLKTAYAELGLDYAAQKAKLVDPSTANAGRPSEVWHARDGITSYPTPREFLKAVAGFQATGAKLNATYVYDRETGLKLFGKTAFFVQGKDGEFATFLRKGEAEAHAAKAGGKVLSFDEAVASAAS
ncbi:ABC transporter substrate-binding protein [Azospirillum sp. TSO22-1]|uniref:ABC transporter substrate-binding protein n=1 Tax=Azospirillum sp. TSO22-1 TaxID=716789 RepID=UPI0018EEA9CB|nr:ABC transporter substrate-binding protein [Azospirillum sp. TSO22-1]